MVRFAISSVMDAIEQRLTTDVAAAQAVVDLGVVVRCAELDGGGRAVNLVRIGMVADALSRYLVDEGAMLYGVASRDLLADQELTSKERMVLGRWLDDGRIEVAATPDGRALEVADLTGLPLISLRAEPAEVVARYGRLADEVGRVLRLVPKGGVGALTPMDSAVSAATDTAALGAAPDAAATDTATPDPVSIGPAGTAPEVTDSSGDAPAPVVATAKVATVELTEDDPLPLPAEVLIGRSAAKIARTRVAQRRFMRADPPPAAVPLLSRSWRCDGYDCPAFGQRRQSGQPIPRLRDGVPVCPRHDEPVSNVGPRVAAYPVSIVVDDLPRHRLVVREGEPVQVGSATDDPDVVPVSRWLHEAAAAWISPVHVRLEVRDDDLVVTDLSDNGTVMWQRSGPDDRGATRMLRRDSRAIGQWDTVELYTGIEICRGDRRVAVLGRDELTSVLIDAPTAAHQQV